MSSNQKVNKPFLIGVAGGTASGKSTVCDKIMAKLGQDCQRRVALIKQDSFYRNLTQDELNLAKIGRYNFDHPDAVDEQAMFNALKDILEGKPVKLPIHDYHDNMPKSNEFNEIQSADVVLFEGMLIFYFPKVRDMFNMKLFVDTDSDTRLARRVMRDVKERGRNLEIVLDQYDQFVKPAFEEFCQPTKKHADMIIPKGADNEVAIGLINHNVTFLLTSLRNRYFRSIFPNLNVNLEVAVDSLKSSIATSTSSTTTTTTTANTINNEEDVENKAPTPSPLFSSNLIPTSSGTVRSRSNSRASSTTSLLANQRLNAGIKEELDTQNTSLDLQQQSRIDELPLN